MNNETKVMSPQPEDVARRLREAEPAFRLDCRAKIAGWIAYAMRYSKRFEVSHSFDPPWDCSGIPFQTIDGFDPAKYESTEAFLDEPSGGTEATYASGCGLRPRTYGDDLRDLLRDLAHEWADSFLPKTDDDGDAFRELDEACGEPVGELLSLLPLQIEEDVHAWSLAELLVEGDLAARREKKRREDEAEEHRIQQAKRAERAGPVFESFVQSYRLRVGPFPQGYTFTKNDACWPALRVLLEDMSAEDRGLLSDKLSTSNSIREWLRGER